MEFVRLRTAADPRFSAAMELYHHSFPRHEQREAASQNAIMALEDYHFNLLFNAGTFVGALLYWETADFLYVEHFCVDSTLRGKGYGQAALEALGQRGKPVILEIDPPTEPIALRRKGFYERSGYRPNPFPHVHPPYHAGNRGHQLVVMSYPRPLTQEEYDRFAAYLGERVMGK